jgi:hypothetical protein
MVKKNLLTLFLVLIAVQLPNSVFGRPKDTDDHINKDLISDALRIVKENFRSTNLAKLPIKTATVGIPKPILKILKQQNRELFKRNIRVTLKQLRKLIRETNEELEALSLIDLGKLISAGTDIIKSATGLEKSVSSLISTIADPKSSGVNKVANILDSIGGIIKAAAPGQPKVTQTVADILSGVGLIVKSANPSSPPQKIYSGVVGGIDKIIIAAAGQNNPATKKVTGVLDGTVGIVNAATNSDSLTKKVSEIGDAVGIIVKAASS